MDKENQTNAEIEHEADALRIAGELVVLLKKVEVLKKKRQLIDDELAELARPDYEVDQQQYDLIKKAKRQKKHKRDCLKRKSRRSSSDIYQRF